MQLSFDRIWFASAERGELVAADLLVASYMHEMCVW